MIYHLIVYVTLCCNADSMISFIDTVHGLINSNNHVVRLKFHTELADSIREATTLIYNKYPLSISMEPPTYYSHITSFTKNAIHYFKLHGFEYIDPIIIT